MASVWTGSVVFAAAGLLGGRPATSHPRSLDHMRTIDPTIEVRPEARYVDDGDIVTASGSAPGSTWLCTRREVRGAGTGAPGP